ncbi:hypothetical protein BDV06DRAFT_211251 [Aspergillus oleicola]
MTFMHGSYTVAWVCALPLELAAAKAILDELHPTLPQPKSDHNVYTLGSVSGHNVVVACLPAGIYGTTSAASAVSHLMSTYQNIRFGLMVGIGGGVPRENPDIRLGDIMYDYGKTLHSGRFHRTGLLNKPPLLLLKVIAQMESDYILGKASLGNIMASNLQNEEVHKQFPRPSKDQLFQSTYNHVSNRPNYVTCDHSQLVDHPERVTEEPHIHYGLVASGNQVMKDARARDQTSQELNILCFEMEAAGLMDEMPLLVIRGICDYCDSHKYKEWQPYAAFVAAAYAKALLMQVPFQEQTSDLRKSIPEKRHWMIPFRKNPGFVGREGEIAKVEKLIRQTNGPSKVTICGLGGVGKTQIALELAYCIREASPTCSVFWIQCTSYASVEQAYMGIAQTIGLLEIKPADVKECVKAYLSQLSGHEWLLIFNNTDDMDIWVGSNAGATGLENFLPQSEQGHILFTTRNRKLAVRLASPFVVDVPELDTKTGVKMLEKALLRNNLLENTDVSAMISQAAAYINSNDIELSDYTTLLKEQESDVIKLLSEDFGDDARYQDIQNPVATTWLISFQQIQQLNPLAADYLSFMACINPRDIPQSLLPEAPSSKKKIDAIGLLKAFSFVNEQVKDHALSLHRLVHLSTRNWLRRERQFSQQIQKTAEHLNQNFPDNNHENQKVWREYLPHALSLVGERDFKKEQAKHFRLLQNIGRCLRKDGRYHEAAMFFEEVVKLQNQERGDIDLSSLTSISDLAWKYRDQGRWKEAEELEVQAMEADSRVLGPEHPDTLSSMANLASTYRNQGRLKEAEELQAEELQLSSICRDQGRLKEAEELEVQAMEARSQVLGPEHPDTLTSMANMAYTLYSQNKINEAIVLMEKCVRLRGRLLGPSHPKTLNSARFLGEWKETADLLTKKNQPPIQPEDDRPIGDTAQDGCSPADVLTKANGDGVLINPHQDSVRPRTPSRVFLEAHPLVLASRDGSPVMRGHDLHEVD